jgi:hypothetical protein
MYQQVLPTSAYLQHLLCGGVLEVVVDHQRCDDNTSLFYTLLSSLVRTRKDFPVDHPS